MMDFSIDKLPPSEFAAQLIKMNRLDLLGFDRFIFYPGMLFNTLENWWGGKGLRRSSHEGLDICFFTDHHLNQYCLDETIRIPAMFSGTIVCVIDDYLGKTVVMRHDDNNDCKRAFCTFYAHIKPDLHVKAGDVLGQGEPLGAIADVRSIPTPLLSHLHLSAAWEDMLPRDSGLSWKILNQLDRSAFIDPLDFLNISYSIIKEIPNKNASFKFIKFNQVLTRTCEAFHAK